MNTSMITGLILILMNVPAHGWERISIPGAQCGDGSEYFVYLDRGEPRELAFLLMGGGACWSKETCFGAKRMTWVHSIPVMTDVGGITGTGKNSLNPIKKFTKVFFPYCTGDVHLGEQIAWYKGHKVRHVGKLNVKRTYEYLGQRGYIDFKFLKRFLMYGYSAGAIGALYHFTEIDNSLGPEVDKLLVADAPGLHFGPKFWGKFPKAWVADIDRSLERVGYRRTPGVGLIAPMLRELCHRYPTWKFYFMQGTKDLVMSEVFGEINREEHHKLIFSKDGIAEITLDQNDNCSSWLPQTEVHTFLATDVTASKIQVGGVSGFGLLKSALIGEKQINYW